MVFRLLKLFLKSIGGHYRCGHAVSSKQINSIYSTGGYVFIASLLLFFQGCTSDIAVVSQKETRVVVDSYIQPYQIEELDVLVVLDTSGSMSDNYEDVADGMELLRHDIESLTLDYQFGYITMDPTDLSSSTFFEEGFGATYTFFNSEEGLAFKRPEADFLLFLISDEDEQSAITASLFYEWLHQEFKDVDHDVVCVVNPDTGEGSGWANEIGHKYIELSDLYEKNTVDLDSDDWSAWLSDSSYLTQRKDYIVLSESDPIVESIIVYVNSEITNDWHYIKDTNIVQLSFVPSYGELVEVGYKVLL